MQESTTTEYYYDEKEVTYEEYHTIKNKFAKKDKCYEEYMKAMEEFSKKYKGAEMHKYKNGVDLKYYEKKIAYVQAEIKFNKLISWCNPWKEFQSRAKVVEYSGIKRKKR